MSRTGICCRDCGRPGQLHGHGRCSRCYNRHRREAAKRACPRCGRPGLIREQTGICGRCQRALRPRQLPAPRRRKICGSCGELRVLQARGRCARCYQHDPAMVHACAERIAARLEHPPDWLAAFAGYLAGRLSPGRGVGLLRQLAGILGQGNGSPAAVLAAARPAPPPSPGALARALEAFFTAARLTLPSDAAGQAAAIRRARRVAEVPAAFRAAAAAFDVSQLEARDRARRAGTRPRSDRTLEINLTAVRDLARFLITRRARVTGWQLVTAGDVEAFLAATANPGHRARQLQALRAFFRWARLRKMILTDPTAVLRASSNIAFHGRLLTPGELRRLYRRWTTGAGELHPHEPAAGLLGLLHGASPGELRRLRHGDLDLPAATIRLGRRPQPTPLDPATAAALRRCLDHHDRHHRDGNPHLLVNQKSKTTAGPVSASYLEELLARAGVTPLLLRVTRLAHLVTTLDPVIVAEAFGVRHGTVLHYLAGHVDPGRLASL